jgi:lipoprotein-releasing system ATP-binding protein
MIQARSLTKIYKTPASQVLVFEGINLEVKPGSLIAIIGPSGAGKSTLLHLLGGLDRPTRGDVLFKNESIFQWGAAELARFRNRHIGFVFQFHHLLPEFTAFENTMMPRLIGGDDRAQTEAAARQILERVGLSHRLDHKIGEISGGEQQRVAIARALVKQPRVLLADEPTGNLDEDTRDEIIALLENLWRERGLTLVLVTHDSPVARRAQRVAVMSKGRLSLRSPSPS